MFSMYYFYFHISHRNNIIFLNNIYIKGKKILIDPGVLKYKEEYFDIWSKVDAICVTHKHSDHCNVELLETASLANKATSKGPITTPLSETGAHKISHLYSFWKQIVSLVAYTLVSQLLEKLGENIKIYSSSEVKNTYPQLNINIVKENDVITVGDVKTFLLYI